MKNKFFKILKCSITLIIVGYVFFPNISKANILDGPAISVVNSTIALVGNFFLSLTAQLLAISGTFLNLSINLTTHIGDFYNSIPALNEVWLVVRNMSSIFIIFALLYSSIKVIVGAGSSSATKELIAKIVIAGVLINFSLFFTKVLIDGSNLVSLQFYRAIAPKSANSLSSVSSAFNDGGISDVFMSSLKIPQIYRNNATLGAVDVGLSIGIATIGGMLMMIIAAISFLGAAVAFMFRTAYLIFIMAVSPIYFAAMIFPQLEDKAGEVTKIFKSQLIFMPAYLFLMYVALKLISSPGFSAIFNQGSNGVPAAGEGPFGPTFIGVVVQFVIASIFINAPLLVAIQMGASGAKFAEGWTKALNDKVKGLPGAFGQHTIGRGAKIAQESFNSSGFASRNPNIAILANKAFKSGAEASFGGTKGGFEKRNKEFIKERTEYGTKSIKLSDRDKKKAVSEGLSEWETKNERLASSINFKKEIINDPRITDQKVKDEARRDLAKLELENKARINAEKAGTRNKYLEDEALKARKLGYAGNLSSGLMGNEWLKNPFVKGANADAAKAIRDELSKSEDKKLADKIKKMIEKEDKEEKDDKDDKQAGGDKK